MPKFHKDTIDGWDGDLKSLARAICDLKYDKTAEFIMNLCEAVSEDANADLNRGRSKLSNRLNEAAMHLLGAHDKMNKAWMICEPYMREDK